MENDNRKFIGGERQPHRHIDSMVISRLLLLTYFAYFEKKKKKKKKKIGL
jgi:hypothetical protein